MSHHATRGSRGSAVGLAPLLVGAVSWVQLSHSRLTERDVCWQAGANATHLWGRWAVGWYHRRTQSSRAAACPQSPLIGTVIPHFQGDAVLYQAGFQNCLLPSFPGPRQHSSPSCLGPPRPWAVQGGELGGSTHDGPDTQPILGKAVSTFLIVSFEAKT